MLRGVTVEREDGTKTITVYGLGNIHTAHSDHPNFAAIEAALMNPDVDPQKEELEDLFNVARAITRSFEKLTDRISVKGSTIYLDMEPVHNALADAILRCLNAGEDFKPLVNFLERLSNNPNPKSVEALWTWLDNRNFTITPDGMIVGYKGVSAEAAPVEGEHAGVSASAWQGHAFVNGVEYGSIDESGHLRKEHVPYPVGATIEMPRSEVVHDRGVECSEGLHVGTFEFAMSYAKPTLLEVWVDPRDVVSVPASSNSTKIRVCRLLVVDEITEKYEDLIKHVVTPTFEEDWLEEMDWDSGFEDEEDEEFSDEDLMDFEEASPISERHPDPAEFANMILRAKRRRQSLVPYIERMTAREGCAWSYSGEGIPSDPLNWKVEIPEGD